MLYVFFYIYIFYAFLCAFLDLRTKSVPLLVHLVALLPGLLRFCFLLRSGMSAPDAAPIRTVQYLLLPLLPGLLAVVFSRCSREAFGYGDALFLLLSGLYLPMDQLLLLLLSGILLGFFVSVFLLVCGRIRGCSMGQTVFPWIPCTLPALIALCLSVH